MKQYRWPDLSPVIRQHVVVDDQGRYGIGRIDPVYGSDTIWAYPIDVPPIIEQGGARLMTATSWTPQDDGMYTGLWYDYSGVGHVPPGDLRRIKIVSDLGWLLTDYWADKALAGSDQDGHWNYGAGLGKIGGEPPVKGQLGGEMTTTQAEEFAREVGESVKARAIQKAAERGDIAGARKVGRAWLIPYEGFVAFLDSPPKRGRPGKAKHS